MFVEQKVGRAKRNPPKRVSEFLVDAGLLHDAISRVPGHTAFVYRDIEASDRAMPDFVIASARANIISAVFLQGGDNGSIKPLSH